eukprot:4883033-Pleurochrysis_carterae.AAC.1
MGTFARCAEYVCGVRHGGACALRRSHGRVLRPFCERLADAAARVWPEGACEEGLRTALEPASR